MLLKGPLSLPAIARRMKITKRELMQLLDSVCTEGTVVKLPANTHGTVFFTLRELADAEKLENINDKAQELGTGNVVSISQAGGRR